MMIGGLKWTLLNGHYVQQIHNFSKHCSLPGNSIQLRLTRGEITLKTADKFHYDKKRRIFEQRYRDGCGS